MKELCIISGKGGTGKTTVTSSFATLAEEKVIVDCDVDAPDLHLIMKPEIIEKNEFRGSSLAVIDPKKCTECDICEEVCEFDAITDTKVNKILCEGCNVCTISCPEDAITLEEQISGYAYISETRFGPMSHAQLDIAEEASGKLITQVRNNAKEIAEERGLDLIITDGPPGIGCPVISSLSGVDLTLIITEPTHSGLHDLSRILELVKGFGATALVCINKYDINTGNADAIIKFCESRGVPVVGKLPYDPIVTEAMVAGKAVVEFGDSEIANQIKKMWGEVKDLLMIQ
ncbi:MAG: 4Fe-4S binding protein [Halobacteriota archaeon]|nr:4Fe-4S binding protein [Halobacteriota archaeon]